MPIILQRTAIAALVALSLGSTGALAQRAPAPPRRPRLPAGADTNNAETYRLFAEQRLEDDPDKAAAAFYWARRIDPGSADYVYGYRCAMMLGDKRVALEYLDYNPDARRRPLGRLLDSLITRERLLNPFLRPRLDDVVINELVKDVVRQSIRRQGEQVSELELSYEVNVWLNGNDAGLRPYLAYARGRIAEAIGGWRDQAHQYPRDAEIHIALAKAFAAAGQLDSARGEMTTALGLARAADTATTHLYLESRASLEYAIGRLDDLAGLPDSARAAYQRALNEDLAYYPAHVQLAGLAYQRADTATVLLELGRAVEIKEDDYLAQVAYGGALGVAGRLDSAQAHLQRAIEIEPWVARPRFILAVVLERRGDAAAASTEAYRTFAERAARTDPWLPVARAKLAQTSP